ncbi:hypothetical protein LDENG_00197630 [Lucifuga dentata]|nr:hypothetical protein LDENG_00197630 [Lucifuga dentata]
MLLVLLLFLLCGNVYTLLCQPWDDGQLLKLIDTPGLIPDFEVGAVLRLETNITYSDIYSGCEKNESLWSTLRLYEVVDLGDLLNVSKYTEEVQQYFEGVDISLSSLTVLSPEVEKQLSSISAEAKDFDFALITQQINNVSSTNLNSMADKLNEITNIEADLGVQTELRNEASDLRQIQTSIETNIFPQLEELNRTAENLRSFAEKLSGVVGEVLSKVGAAQDFLNANTTQIIRTESREFLDCQMSYFTAFADWANLTVTQQVGRCGPVAGAVDSVNIIVCSNIVESLNAFWFSLGWCMIFFIFSIIFSVKLAKYYRRMKYTDVFDNHIIMNHIPRAK